jgi:hypothetical protein
MIGERSQRIGPASRLVGGFLVVVTAVAGVVLLPDATPSSAAQVDARCADTGTDAATIQSAINASSPGDEIVIDGPCLITSTLRLLNDRTYRGDSRAGTILTQADGANLAAMMATQSWVDNVTYTSSGIRIEKLTLDGNRAANTGTVPLMLRAWNSRVYDVEIAGAPGDGIRATSVSQNGTRLVNTTQVNSIIADVFIRDSGGHGIHVVDPDNAVTDWIVERAWIADSDGSGIDLDNSAGWQIRNLHLYGSDQHAINARRCFNTGIHDNYVENFGTEGTGGTTYFGIRCTVQGGVGNTIVGNKVNQMFGLPAAGSFVSIGLDGVNYGAGRVTVAANTVIGQGSTREIGLNYSKANGPSLSVVSTGNLVDLVGTARRLGTGVTVTAGQ